MSKSLKNNFSSGRGCCSAKSLSNFEPGNPNNTSDDSPLFDFINTVKAGDTILGDTTIIGGNISIPDPLAINDLIVYNLIQAYNVNISNNLTVGNISISNNTISSGDTITINAPNGIFINDVLNATNINNNIASNELIFTDGLFPTTKISIPTSSDIAITAPNAPAGVLYYDGTNIKGVTDIPAIGDVLTYTGSDVVWDKPDVQPLPNPFTTNTIQTNNGSPTTITNITLPENKTIVLKAYISALNIDGSEGAGFYIQATYRNNIQIQSDIISQQTDSLWIVNTNLINTNLMIQVTGEVGKTIEWTNSYYLVISPFVGNIGGDFISNTIQTINTPTNLTSINIPVNNTIIVYNTVSAHRSDTNSESGGFTLISTYNNNNGVISQISTNVYYFQINSALWSVNTVNIGNDIVIQVTGENGKTIDWVNTFYYVLSPNGIKPTYFIENNVVTVDNTQTTLFSMSVPCNCNILLFTTISSHNIDTDDDGAGFIIQSTYRNSGGTLIQISTDIIDIQQANIWQVASATDNDNLTVKVIGENGKTIHWAANSFYIITHICPTESGSGGQNSATIQTTDATITTIDTIPTTSDNVYYLIANIVCIKTNTVDVAATYTLSAGFFNSGGILSLIGVIDLLANEINTNYNVNAIVSGTNILIQVQGDVGEDVNWKVIYNLITHNT
jgi:hypothetical protein